MAFSTNESKVKAVASQKVKVEQTYARVKKLETQLAETKHAHRVAVAELKHREDAPVVADLADEPAAE